jgi:hypothetical protein
MNRGRAVNVQLAIESQATPPSTGPGSVLVKKRMVTTPQAISPTPIHTPKESRTNRRIMTVKP